MLMTPKLRAALTAAYESERANWGDEYTDHFLAKLAALTDGPFNPQYDTDADELELVPSASVGLGLDYFGLGALG